MELVTLLLPSQPQEELVVQTLVVQLVEETNAVVFPDTAELPKTIVPTQEVAYLDMEDATQMQRLPEHQLLMLQDH